MAKDGYFTSLLSGTQRHNCMTWNGLSSSPEEKDSSNVTTAAPANGNKKRLKNFSEKEYELLVRARLTVGIDPIQSTSQKRSVYWARIYDFFHSEKEIALDRIQSSLIHRWSSIQECMNKFYGYVSRIEGRHEIEKTFENKLMDACALYKAEDKDNKAFQFLHCWNILRLEPKWQDKMNQLASTKSCNKKQKATDPIIDLTGNLNGDNLIAHNNENVSLEGDAPKRPIDMKKAK